MRPRLRLYLFCLAAFHVVTTAWAQITLVDSGQPRATIVIGANASAQAVEAASLLQEYVKKMSGATLPVQREGEISSGPRVFVGRSDAVRALGLTLPEGHTHQMNEEAFTVRTVGDDLVLAGNEDWNYRGTIFSVADFLEKDLGCRWFFPGPFGEVIPKQETVIIGALDRTERPSFRIRRIWYSGWFPVSEQDNAWMKRWCDLNKLNALDLSLPGDGSVQYLAPAEKYFESKPEIYAIDGKGNRMKDMLCMSEPEAVRIAVETIKEAFRDDPDRLSYGFAPPDGFPVCHCERCQRFFPGFEGLGHGDPSLSEVWFKFANKIAAEVNKEFPDRWVLTNGYANRVRLPEGIADFSPNLGIQSAVIAACAIHRTGDPRCWQRTVYEDIMERWFDKLEVVFIYDYDPAKAIDNLPFPALHCLKHDIPWLRDQGAWGFYTEGTNTWMTTHLNYYVRAKLMWNADLDVDALVRDYCERFYGPAANAVEKYIWTLEKAVEKSDTHETWGRLMQWRLILPPVLGKLDRLMAEAESKSATPEEKQRVQVLRGTHEHMKAFLAMEEAAANADYATAIAKADEMLEMRGPIEAVQTGLLPPEIDIAKGQSSSLTSRKPAFEFMATRQHGPRGEMVALLPRAWDFKTDPKRLGTIEQWYLPGKAEGWEPIDTTYYWEAQGYQDKSGWGYWGDAWYRTAFDVPADLKGKPLWLAVSGVYNWGVWVWVNGTLREFEMTRHWRLGYQEETAPFEIDVTDLIKPGERNDIAILVHTREPGRNPRGGLHGRVFLWSPTGAADAVEPTVAAPAVPE
ncbi:MAG: DUF4838 domain-containing protein [Candidatus Hydrogenedentes bacterium]|nr:DUF4838 domain-containing protein [Candidatus Hydrogenedentota bacterium]